MGHRICMVSDFFYPKMGGIECHIHCLASLLAHAGHKITVITHSYGNRVGIRHLPLGIKVYHIPAPILVLQCALPVIWGNLPLIRDILVREKIDIVHGHQSFSSLAHEVLLHATTMGLRTVFTDHSLFSYGSDMGALAINKSLQFTMANVNALIAVSHVHKENMVLRIQADPDQVYVIPNAVIPAQFAPDPSKRDPETVTVVTVSRLVYRKGVDLMVAVIPLLCKKHPKLRFIIVGDGPMRLDLVQMQENECLYEQVDLRGPVRHDEVRDVLVQGHMYFNASLTDAFCTSVVEAACAGLFVISTRVGGIPEVLPPDMIEFGDPSVEGICAAMERALEKIDTVDAWELHRRVKEMYSWEDVARRILVVYEAIMLQQPLTLLEKFENCFTSGPIAGKLNVWVLAMEEILFRLCEWWRPRSEIDLVPD